MYQFITDRLHIKNVYHEGIAWFIEFLTFRQITLKVSQEFLVMNPATTSSFDGDPTSIFLEHLFDDLFTLRDRFRELGMANGAGAVYLSDGFPR